MAIPILGKSYVYFFVMTEYLKIFKLLPFPSLLLIHEEGHFVIKDVSDRYSELTGKSAKELIGKHYPGDFSAVPPSHPILVQREQALQKVLETGKPFKIDCIRHDLQCPEKQVKKETYWQVENIPILDCDGNISFVLNLARDKTTEILKEKERVENNQELELHLQKNNLFIEKNSDGLYSLDRNGNFLSLNEGLAKIAEVPREEMLNTNFLPFCTPHYRDLTLQKFQKALEGEEQNFEAEFVTAKGNIVVLEICLIPMRVAGKIKGTYGIAKNITGLRTVEEELFSMEQTFKALVQEGSDLICILNPDGSYKFVSNSSTTVLGISPEEFLGNNAFDYIHPDDKERIIKDFAVLEKRDQIRTEPFRFQDQHGEWRWLESTATNFIEDPYVQGIVVNSKEVTELVERNMEIKQLFERYRLAVSATEDLIYDWDIQQDEIVRFFNGNIKPFGYSRREVDKKEFWRNSVHPEELEYIDEIIQKTLNNPEKDQLKTQYRFRRKDGSYATIVDRAHIIRDEKGKALRLIGATNDISNIVENQKELKAANSRFNFVMQATKEIIWDWDIKKNQIKRSGSFKKYFGYNISKKASVENFWCQKIVEKDRERVMNSIRKAIDDVAVKKWEEEYSFIKRNGEIAYVVDRGYILRDSTGKAIRMVGAALDVTESRQMLKEIKKQNKVLKEVAWEQAHVVRAPLARLRGLLNLLESESYEEWSRQELLELISDSANELDEIIKNIIKRTEENG